jgi:cytochrome c5
MDISIKTLMALLPALAATLAMAATPDENYTRLCTTCHLPGVHGAPRVGDRENWTQRLRSGLNIVYRNAIEGVPNTAMLAKGGHTELSDIELRAIVDYMIAATALPASVLRHAIALRQTGTKRPRFHPPRRQPRRLSVASGNHRRSAAAEEFFPL